MSRDGCDCCGGGAHPAHAIAAALADGDLDRALGLGLLEAAPCPTCSEACRAALLQARAGRRAALAARERYRARTARLARRAEARAARRAVPASPAAADATPAPALPPAAADALARALARAGLKR